MVKRGEKVERWKGGKKTEAGNWRLEEKKKMRRFEDGVLNWKHHVALETPTAVQRAEAEAALW